MAPTPPAGAGAPLHADFENTTLLDGRTVGQLTSTAISPTALAQLRNYQPPVPDQVHRVASATEPGLGADADTTGKGSNPFVPDEAGHEAVLEAIRLASMERLLEIQDLVARTLRDRYEKTLAVLFSDIAGSSEYFKRYGDAAGRFMVNRHQQLVATFSEKHSGRVVKSLGDGVLVVFPTAPRAVAAAIQIQRGVAESNARLPESEQFIVRVGVHYGAVLVNDRDRDVFGDTVNVSASVQAQAAPGQILVTDSVRNHVAAGLAVRDAGEFHIKGRPRPQHLFEVIWQDPLRADPSRERTLIEIPAAAKLAPLPDEPLSLVLDPRPSWRRKVSRFKRWFKEVFGGKRPTGRPVDRSKRNAQRR